MADTVSMILGVILIVAIVIGIPIASGIATQYMMEAKGYYKKIYFWWGFFGGYFAYIRAKAMPDARFSRDENSEDYFFENSGYYDDDKKNHRY